MKMVKVFWLLGMLVAGALILSACGSSNATPAANLSSEQTVVQQTEADHNDGDQHNEGAHVDDHAGDQHNEADHSAEEGHHHHGDVPEAYHDLTNPLAGDDSALAAGKVIYEADCAACHGPQGKGDGPASAALDPKPADLADADMMSEASDAFIFWRVSEGGTMEPFNSAMPSWKQILSEKQRWQVITYVESFSQ